MVLPFKVPLDSIEWFFGDNQEEAKSVLKLIDKLEEDEDVQNVFHNMEMTEEVMSQIDS